MRILLVNKFHYRKGGSETYTFELAKLLQSHGNEVAFFSMQNDQNIQTENREYFVPFFDLNHSSKRHALKVIYAKKNKKIMEQALDDFQPDIVHLNNFQRQLSASILKPIYQRKIPIVYTMHDLQPICPAINMIDGHNQVCEACLKGKYFSCLSKKCVKNSRLKSLLGVMEAIYYRSHKIYSQKITHIITPSYFYKRKLVADGIQEKKITAIHNFLDLKEYPSSSERGKYALYFGRLSREKGILQLLQAMKKVPKGVLYVAGDGDEKEKILAYLKEHHLEKRVILLGHLNPKEMKHTIAKARFIVIPSIWYENCPYSVLETMAYGKPIIGSNMAGIPELVIHEKNGYIYPSQDIEALSTYLQELFEQDEKIDKFSQNAKRYAKKYGKERYYQQLMKVYQKALKERRGTYL